MSGFDPVDLRMSSRQWELQGLVPSGKALDHVSLYGTDLSDEDHAENMCQMFVNLPAEIITQGVCVYICSDILNYQGNSKIQNFKNLHRSGIELRISRLSVSPVIFNQSATLACYLLLKSENINLDGDHLDILFQS